MPIGKMVTRTRGAHGLNEIRAREQNDFDSLSLSTSYCDTTLHYVNLLFKVVEYYGRRLVLLLDGFPRVDVEPSRRLVRCDPCHGHTVLSAC